MHNSLYKVLAIQSVGYYYRICFVYFIYRGRSAEASRLLLLDRVPELYPVPFSRLREEYETDRNYMLE